jgi:hypothetical protein
MSFRIKTQRILILVGMSFEDNLPQRRVIECLMSPLLQCKQDTLSEV